MQCFEVALLVVCRGCCGIVLMTMDTEGWLEVLYLEYFRGLGGRGGGGGGYFDIRLYEKMSAKCGEGGGYFDIRLYEKMSAK